MELRSLGDSGVRVSSVGLGCNNFGGAMWHALDLGAARGVIEAALEVGINHFDTADVYGFGASEEVLGEVLKDHRDNVVIATKFGMMPREDGTPSGRPTVVRACLEASLARLQTDYVDVFYYHIYDGVTPIEETLGAMDELVAEGKARTIACSNFTAEQLHEAHELASGAQRFTAVQNQYSLLERDADDEVVPAVAELGLSFIPHSPLAGGLLTGKYRRGEEPPPGSRLSQAFREMLSDRTFDSLDELTDYAEQRGHTLHELAIAALVSTPTVASVIIGAMSVEQVRFNAHAASWKLDDNELTALPRIVGGGMHW